MSWVPLMMKVLINCGPLLLLVSACGTPMSSPDQQCVNECSAVAGAVAVGNAMAAKENPPTELSIQCSMVTSEREIPRPCGRVQISKANATASEILIRKGGEFTIPIQPGETPRLDLRADDTPDDVQTILKARAGQQYTIQFKRLID